MLPRLKFYQSLIVLSIFQRHHSKALDDTNRTGTGNMDNTKLATNGHEMKAVSSPASHQYETPIVSSNTHAQISVIPTSQPDDDLSLWLELTGYFDVEHRRRLLEQARKLEELDELRTRTLLEFNATAGSIFSLLRSLSRAASFSISNTADKLDNQGMGAPSPLTVFSPKRSLSYGDERQEPAKAARVSQGARRTPSTTLPKNHFTYPPWSRAIMRNFEKGQSSNAPESSTSQRAQSTRDKDDLSNTFLHVSPDISAPRSSHAERAEPSPNSPRDRRNISLVSRKRNESHISDDSRPDELNSGEVIKPGERFHVFIFLPRKLSLVERF